ncbi:MAG: prolyl oligopeptidase family serine peptidase [Alphaproteobacteria bacterium]|nr:prolyl oligopeptidase family serine peptidase [Alphaproteobacteria bacterium]
MTLGWRAAMLLAASLIATPAWAGTIETRSFASPALGRDIAASIYVPDAPGPWPVVYLLHGYGGGERDWLKAGGARTTADAVFAEPSAPPMLLVMPGAGNSWYVDSERYGDWDTAIARDLVAAVDAAYPTRANRESRFAVGLSMGGYGALRLAVHHPDVFRGAAAFSPAIFADVDRVTVFPPFQIAFFAGAFGDPLDLDAFNRRNIFRPLEDLRTRTEGQPTDFYLMTGDHDGLGLWDGTLRFFRAARAAGHPVELRVHDGDHAWPLWRAELAPALRWIGGLLPKAR